MKWLARIPGVVNAMRRSALNDLKKAASRSISKAHILERLLADREACELNRALIASTFDRMPERIGGTNNDIRITRHTEYPLEEIEIPVLIVHGRDDPRVRFDPHATSLAHRIPRARLVAVEEGEHVAIFTHLCSMVGNLITAAHFPWSLPGSGWE